MIESTKRIIESAKKYRRWNVCSGVTLLCAAPLLIEICRPYPPLKFRVPKKKKKKKKKKVGYFFCRPLQLFAAH